MHVGGERVHRDRRGQRPGERARHRRCATRSATATRRSVACTSPTTRCGCSTPPRAPARSRGCSSTPPTASARWTTIGVSENIIEASLAGALRLAGLRLAPRDGRRVATDSCPPTRSCPRTLEDEPRQEPNLAPGVQHAAGEELAGRPAGRPRARVSPPGKLLGSPGPERRVRASRSPSGCGTGCSSRPTSTPRTRWRSIGELAMKRAAHFGRAPVMTDLDIAASLLGYKGEVDPTSSQWRTHAVQGANHEYEKRRRDRRRGARRGAPHAAPGRGAPHRVPRAAPAIRRPRRLIVGVDALPTSSSSCEPRSGASPSARSRPMPPKRTTARSTRGRASPRTATLGFVSLGFPEAFGGDGADTLTYALLVEELVRTSREKRASFVASVIAAGAVSPADLAHTLSTALALPLLDLNGDRRAAAAAQRHRRQARGAVPGRRARQARQPAVHRRRRPDRPGSRRAHQVRDPAVARVGHRRARQARQAARGAAAPAPARRSKRWSSGDFEFDVTDDVTAAGKTAADVAADVEDAPVVRFLQKMLIDAINAARLRPALRALRVPLPRALPRRRRAARDHAAADRDQGQAVVAHQGHLAGSTSPRSACRRTAA